MATNNYVGLVGSDGEDPFARYVNSGGTTGDFAGAIAVGPAATAQDAFNAMQVNPSADAVLLSNPNIFFFWTKIGVGYSNGYWMVMFSH